MSITCKDMVVKYLKENGYDGLCGEECGCVLKDGLFPCMTCEPLDCVAGYQRPADEEDLETCECKVGDLIMVPGKRPRRVK
jgi:hypothetical protein